MVENRTCTYLGIEVRQIEHAGDVLDLACERHGLDADEVWEWVDNDFHERFDVPDWSHFGNVVTRIIFDCLMEALERNGIERDRIDYYINGGLDTSFYIDGEEIA